MKSREEIQTEILAGVDSPENMEGLQVRPITFATLLLLRKLGNSLADTLERGGAFAADDMEAIAEFLWVQCAPWDTVRRLCASYRKGSDRSLLDATILEFALSLSPAQMSAAVQAIVHHGEGLSAVAAEVIPDKDTPAESKN